jgi:hypothetical protein
MLASLSPLEWQRLVPSSGESLDGYPKFGRQRRVHRALWSRHRLGSRRGIAGLLMCRVLVYSPVQTRRCLPPNNWGNDHQHDDTARN